MIFSKLDLQSDYWQTPIAREDVEKMAFYTHYGHFKWLVLPFGLTNTSTSFIGHMNRLFQVFLDKYVIIFIDDILVYNKFSKEYEQHLQEELHQLQDSRFYCKQSKCDFGSSSHFLGHMCP